MECEYNKVDIRSQRLGGWDLSHNLRPLLTLSQRTAIDNREAPLLRSLRSHAQFRAALLANPPLIEAKKGLVSLCLWHRR